MPKVRSQANSAAYPAVVAGNCADPSIRPAASAAAAVWVSLWVSTPPVISMACCAMVVMTVLFTRPGRAARTSRAGRTKQ